MRQVQPSLWIFLTNPHLNSKAMAIKTRNKVNVAFSMSSMTDIVFLLLIFFMITSTLIAPNALKLLLPKSTNQTMTEKPIISVCIEQSGPNSFRYAIGQEYVALDMLEMKLRSKIANEPEPTVSLHVDKSVPMEQVVNIMNIAKDNHYRLILATQPK